MVRRLPWVAFSLTLLGSAASISLAQEPAFIVWRSAVRFEENPGFFHYILPCRTAKDFGEKAATSEPAVSASEPALCWPVQAVNMVKVDGKFEGTPPAAGQLIVSADHVRFEARDPKQSSLSADFKPGEVNFEHESGKGTAFFGTTDHFYKFFFLDLCEKCTPANPAPPDTNTAQLEIEFGLVRDSIKTFDSVYQRIQEISAQFRVEVRLANQPAVSDPTEAMGLYGRINAQLAGRCEEPAKSCIASYAKYQTCMGSAQATQGCGVKPDCTAVCRLSAEDIRSMAARPCVQQDQTSATLIPDWSGAVRKKNPTAPAAPFAAGYLDRQPATSASTLATVGCSVQESFNRASIPAPPPASGFGVAGMDGLAGGGVPGALANTSPGSPAVQSATPKRVPISAGVAQGMLLQRVTPVYPPVAKAARVQGMVVLQATISTAGEVVDLQVVSGPDLLKSAAVDAVKQWKYRPYLVNGEPVTVLTTINVVFTLGGSAASAPQVPAEQPQQ